MTRDIPGLLVRSVFADESGEPILSAGTFLTSDESPLKERWGGWYATGSLGRQQHLGNVHWREKEGADPELATAATAPSASSNHGGALPASVDASAYLTPHSDVVALLVLAHQVEAHNRFTRAAQGTLRALRDEKILSDALGEAPKAGEHSDSTRARIKSSCEPLVEYLLFTGEAPLADAVAGDTSFAKDFTSRGPRDSRGRSLRDFDLRKRLLRYPCSYMIYSSAMEGLPAAAKQYVYRRLWEVLSGKETGKPYDRMSGEDRAAVKQILSE